MPAVSHADIITNLTSFNRLLRAEILSPRTIETYSESVRQFIGFLESRGMPLNVANLRWEHVESFVEHLLERWKPATANNHYRRLQAFFKWLIVEGEVYFSWLIRPTGPPAGIQPERGALFSSIAGGKTNEVVSQFVLPVPRTKARNSKVPRSFT